MRFGREVPLAIWYKKNQDGAAIFAGKHALEAPTCRPFRLDLECLMLLVANMIRYEFLAARPVIA